jgi:hypothetical protein
MAFHAPPAYEKQDGRFALDRGVEQLSTRCMVHDQTDNVAPGVGPIDDRRSGYRPRKGAIQE